MTTNPHLEQAFGKIDSDYAFLMDCLREVLSEMGKPALAAILPGGGSTITDAGGELDEVEIMHVLSIAFQLLNLVEENVAAQSRRKREARAGLLEEPGLWGENLKHLTGAGFTGEWIARRLSSIHVEPVLTAHPTESKRSTVLHLHRSLYLHMVQLENQMWTPVEREDLRRGIQSILERLLRTGQILMHKPEVEQEVKGILYYLSEIFPPILRKMDLRLRAAWREAGLDTTLLADPQTLPRLSFGNWVGGDRDGHPLVTAEVTRKTLTRFREAGTAVVREQLVHLFHDLSLTSEYQTPPPALLRRTKELEDHLRGAGVEAAWRPRLEPWRHYVHLLRTRLDLGGAAGYTSPAALAADLRVLRESLFAIGASRIAEFEVLPVERIIGVFGFHLASIDIRQNSAFHDKAVEQLLQEAGFSDWQFSQWPEEKRLAFLEKELESPRPFANSHADLGPEAAAVLDCHGVLRDHLLEYGPEGVGSLIVSMTRSLSDLLTVYLLTREAGLTRKGQGGLVCDVAVVPLFETIEDLEQAPGIMSRFLAHPLTRRSLAARMGRRPVQQIMVGYSDSSKDGGYLASQWTLYRAQEALAEAARSSRVELCFFHGRGGTPSRGAGPTHRFLEALPQGSLTGHFRMTEQGETISQKYGNAITAVYNLELLQAGVTACTLRGKAMWQKDEDFLRIAHRLSKYSEQAYRALLTSDGFIDYWAEATPIDALEMSSIGSRPARRTGRRSLEDLRAIPWVFSWNQSRHFLTSWFGAGSALERLRDQHPEDFEILKRMIARWPLLRNVFYNVETSLASADPELMELYASLVRDESVRRRYFQWISGEYRLSGALIDEVFQSPRAIRRPRMIKTIMMRDAGLRQLHRHQVKILREWREVRAAGREGEAERLLPGVLLSINAVSAGLRTTG